MIASHFTLFLVAFAAGSSAQVLAKRVAPELSERTSRLVGGYALIATTGGFCPNDLDVCGGDTVCCPTSLTCNGAQGQQVDSRCCPGSKQTNSHPFYTFESALLFQLICKLIFSLFIAEDCSPGLRTSPFCADDSWSLWDKTQGGIYPDGYFCCAPGAVGLLDGTCIEIDTLVSPTLEAEALAPGGAVLSTSTTVASTAVATSVAGTTVVSKITTTSSSVRTSTSTVAAVSSSVSSIDKSTVTSSSAAVTSSATAVKSASSTSSSAAPSSTETTSGGNSYKILAYGSGWLIETALGLFIAAIL
jgi:hypothetical protein